MPRRNRNAAERTETRWDPAFIRAFMRKLKAGRVEQAYEMPDVPNENTKKGKK